MFLSVSCRHLPTIYQAFLMSATLSEVREEERRRGESEDGRRSGRESRRERGGIGEKERQWRI